MFTALAHDSRKHESCSQSSRGQAARRQGSRSHGSCRRDSHRHGSRSALADTALVGQSSRRFPACPGVNVGACLSRSPCGCLLIRGSLWFPAYPEIKEVPCLYGVNVVAFFSEINAVPYLCGSQCGSLLIQRSTWFPAHPEINEL